MATNFNNTIYFGSEIFKKIEAKCFHNEQEIIDSILEFIELGKSISQTIGGVSRIYRLSFVNDETKIDQIV